MNEENLIIEGYTKKPIVIDFDRCRISEDIGYELDHAAREYGFYAVMSEVVEDKYRAYKFKFDTWRAEILLMETNKTGKKMTEGEKELFVINAPKYAEFQAVGNRIKRDFEVLKAYASALQIKASLVQSKSANRRKEL